MPVQWAFSVFTVPVFEVLVNAFLCAVPGLSPVFSLTFFTDHFVYASSCPTVYPGLVLAYSATLVATRLSLKWVTSLELFADGFVYFLDHLQLDLIPICTSLQFFLQLSIFRCLHKHNSIYITPFLVPVVLTDSALLMCFSISIVV